MRIAVVQTASSYDKAANRDAVARLVADAAQGRPDLVVLPEAMMSDFAVEGESVAEAAEALDGEFVTTLRKAAVEHGVAIVAGMFERSCDQHRPYNTLLAVGADGVLLGAYRKIHLYDAFGYKESDQLTPGDVAPVVIQVGDHSLGLMTCYDLRFPELGRALVDAGAQVLAVPAAWVAGERKAKHWTTLLRARAIENLVYVVGAAQCGPRYTGHSLVVSPTGDEIVEADNSETVLHVSLDLAEVATAREANPSLANRRL